MKKICIGCDRNRPIGKFGKQTRMPDGKNPYCRDCMKLYNKRYRQSHRGIISQQKSDLKYKKNNKDKISEYNKQYYIKNRNRILYNKKCRETTECVMIFDEKPKKPVKKKINKGSIIVINPKRKEDG